MKTMIVGDIHGEWGCLNDLINKHKDEIDLMICCGDFGYWPRLKALWHLHHPNDGIKFQGQKFNILFCDGNHEDHYSLRQLPKNGQIGPQIFYKRRGSTYRLPDGRRILFMGGADSIDKENRMEGVDWFREELISYNDIHRLSDKKIDILITHTCSTELIVDMISYNSFKNNDPCYSCISHIVKKYNPSLWYFGHWHNYKHGKYKNTNWTCLSMPHRTGWWTWLPD